MPPPLAAFLTIGFIVYLFRRDIREKPNVTRALWIPFVWTFICGTRAVTEWLNFFGLNLGAIRLEEGSPVDRLIYIMLIAAGVMVLYRRRVRLATIAQNNQWLTIFLAYCLISVIWSDYPFVALKRLIKVIGHPVMALVVLTEPDPQEALTRVLKRVAYIILPVSILFIKYYPQYGRVFEPWSGMPSNTGITSSKNLLGCDLLILGYFFVWHTLRTWRQPRGKARQRELFFCGGFLFLVYYLFSRCDSKTAFVSLLVGLFILILAGFRWLDKRLIGVYILLIGVGLMLAQTFFGIYEVVLKMLGRNATLTDRTLLWQDLLRADINPILGAGFESFWIGPRLFYYWSRWAFKPNQAHNGYLETYLTLGLVGLALLVILLLATYGKSQRMLLTHFEWGRFRLGFLFAVIAYNWTEAAFKATHFIFLLFYIIALDYPNIWRRSATPAAAPPKASRERMREPTLVGTR